tara:strand:- start:15216 stop:15479 length:264 start_codon:yes stop_codon:yes gene_type:complete
MPQTYEEKKLKVIERYHKKLKNDPEYRIKQNAYYRNWYAENKYKVQNQRRNINDLSNNKNKINYKKKEKSIITEIKIGNFILDFNAK